MLWILLMQGMIGCMRMRLLATDVMVTMMMMTMLAMYMLMAMMPLAMMYIMRS